MNKVLRKFENSIDLSTGFDNTNAGRKTKLSDKEEALNRRKIPVTIYLKDVFAFLDRQGNVTHGLVTKNNIRLKF